MGVGLDATILLAKPPYHPPRLSRSTRQSDLFIALLFQCEVFGGAAVGQYANGKVFLLRLPYLYRVSARLLISHFAFHKHKGAEPRCTDEGVGDELKQQIGPRTNLRV